MNPETLFSIVNFLAILGWIFLIVFPNKVWTSQFVIGVVISLLGLIYTYLLFTSMSPEDIGSFNSLKGVMQLFKNEQAVLAGWVHYLAFDLMVGLFITQNAKSHQINRWFLLPCLFFTFMSGPFGLLLYFILRTIKTKTYFHKYLG